MQVSEAESVVMQVLWEGPGPLAAEDVVAALAGEQEWQEATIKTLLNRLLKKGAITATREGRRYLYSPVLKREAWLLGESEGLLARLFDGRVAPLVAHFSQHRKLDKADIAELRKLLEEIDDGRFQQTLQQLSRAHRRSPRAACAAPRCRPCRACGAG